VKSSVEDKLKDKLGIKKPDAPAPAGQAPAAQPQQQKPSAQDKIKDKLKGILGR